MCVDVMPFHDCGCAAQPQNIPCFQALNRTPLVRCNPRNIIMVQARAVGNCPFNVHPANAAAAPAAQPVTGFWWGNDPAPRRPGQFAGAAVGAVAPPFQYQPPPQPRSPSLALTESDFYIAYGANHSGATTTTNTTKTAGASTAQPASGVRRTGAAAGTVATGLTSTYGAAGDPPAPGMGGLNTAQAIAGLVRNRR